MNIEYLRPLILGNFESRSTDNKNEAVKKSFQSFRRDFVVGAVFGACREVLTNLSATSPPTVFRPGFGEGVVMTGFQLSVFPLVDSLARAHFRPQIRTVPQWAWWTVRTSALSSFILKFLEVTVKKGRKMRPIEDVVKRSPIPIASGIGFELGAGLAQIYLPPAQKMGGSFARNAAGLVIADGASTAALIPFMGTKSVGNALRTWIGSTPLILYDAALYSLVRHGVKGYLK